MIESTNEPNSMELFIHIGNKGIVKVLQSNSLQVKLQSVIINSTEKVFWIAKDDFQNDYQKI